MSKFVVPSFLRSHPESDDTLTAPPARKRSTDDCLEWESDSKPSTSPTPEEGGVSPSPTTRNIENLSPEQKDRIAAKKLEAESKRIVATVGAEKLGPSWLKALLSEFKKPYIKEVYIIRTYAAHDCIT